MPKGIRDIKCLKSTHQDHRQGRGASELNLLHQEAQVDQTLESNIAHVRRCAQRMEAKLSTIIRSIFESIMFSALFYLILEEKKFKLGYRKKNL